MDITEIEGFDNLNDPEGIFASLEARIAGLWGAGESVCLVNGSTVGILAAVMSALSKGGDILMSRRSHRSVYHAARRACGICPIWSVCRIWRPHRWGR